MVAPVRSSPTNVSEGCEGKGREPSELEVRSLSAAQLALSGLNQYGVCENWTLGQRAVCNGTMLSEESKQIEAAKLAAQKDGAGTSASIQSYGIKDEKALIEIAKLVAQQFWGDISVYIQNYGIKDEKALIEIAKLAAQKNARNMSVYIQNYGIKDKKALIEIAKLTAQQDGGGASASIQKYGIKDKKALIEIAKLAAQQDGKSTSASIQNYGIKDKKALIEIAKLAARQDARGMSAYIQNYRIKDQKALIEIAKLIAQQDGRDISASIQKYGIKDKKALIEIAKLAVQQDTWGTSASIQNYGIKDQKALIEIAKLAAQRYGAGTSVYIQNYGIKDKKALIEIAKLAAQQDGGGTSASIQKYEIKDQKALIEIAKLAAQQDGKGTSNSIQNYGIKDQRALIEIAKLAAQQNIMGTFYSIQNYGIKDQKALIEITKLAAQKDGGGTSACIQFCGIKDKKALIEIAKLAAQQDGGGASKFIQNYGIKDQKVLIEIAKLAAQQNGRGTSYSIQNYGIKDQKALIEIATLAVLQEPEFIDACIQKYGIKDQKALIGIAKLAVQHRNWSFSCKIQDYGIKDQKALIEIAKVAVQGARAFNCKIQDYGIKDEAALIEIAKLAAQKSSGAISYRIQTYKIKDEKVRIEIAKLSAQQNALFTWRHINNYSIKDRQALLEIFAKALISSSGNPDVDTWEKVLLYPEGDSKPISLEEARGALAELYPHHKESDTEIILEQKQQLLLFVFGKSRGNVGEFLKCRLPLLLDYREPKNRLRAVDQFIDKALPNPEVLVFYEMLESQCTETLKNKGGAILAMVLSSLYAKGVPKKTLTDIFDQVKRKANGYLDVSKIQSMIRMLLTLLENPALDRVDIDFLLNREIIENERDLVLANCATIEGICLCGFSQRLKKDSLELKTLDEIYRESFQIACGIETLELLPGQNFSTQYQKTFGKFRLSQSVLTYAGKIKEIPTLQPILQKYISSVLREEFHKVRYDIEHNPHLRKIKDLDSSLYAKWQEGSARVDFQETGMQDPTSFDYLKYCKEVIGVQNHLGELDVKYLKDYLAYPEKKIELLEKIKSKEQTPLLEFQSYCIELCSDPFNKQEILSHMEACLMKIAPDIEFLTTDITFMKGGLNSKKPESAVLEIVDSDDPCDVLLAGTEVMGSCQSVNGDPDRNKALLGYMMNGYNRVFAIKNKENGTILARTLVRIALNSDQTKPLLYCEPIYPANTSASWLMALTNFIVNRAKELGIDFVLKPLEPLHILGGLAPFEYSDTALTPGVQSGAFTIKGHK